MEASLADARELANSTHALAEGVISAKARITGAIDTLSAQWGFPPVVDVEGPGAGQSYASRVLELGASLRGRVQDALVFAVRRTMAIFYSGFSVSREEARAGMEAVAGGFTYAEGEQEEGVNPRIEQLKAEAEEPGARLGGDLLQEVLPPDAE